MPKRSFRCSLGMKPDLRPMSFSAVIVNQYNLRGNYEETKRRSSIFCGLQIVEADGVRFWESHLSLESDGLVV
jgi:hypothetical protein